VKCAKPECQRKTHYTFFASECGYFGGSFYSTGDPVYLCTEDASTLYRAYDGAIPVPDWMKNKPMETSIG